MDILIIFVICDKPYHCVSASVLLLVYFVRQEHRQIDRAQLLSILLIHTKTLECYNDMKTILRTERSFKHVYFVLAAAKILKMKEVFLFLWHFDVVKVV